MWTRLLALPPVLLATACGSSDTPFAGSQHEPPKARVGTTRGGAVSVSTDERVAVVANRTAGVVTVLSLDPDRAGGAVVTGKVALDFDAAPGRDPAAPSSEPWAAVIGADGDTAYVVARADGRVYRVSSLRSAPEIDASVAVGAEPTAIAIAPSGATLFVANFGEGTISVITTEDFVDNGQLDLNQALAETGLLGPGVSRVALAHPRALALTDDGDASDSGETLYATEFFSQPIRSSDVPTDLTAPDQNRQGIVYPIPLDDRGRIGALITIQPVADTGFKDAFDHVTSCVPNQLYAAAADGGQLFVTSLCASPAGPIGPPPANADGTPNPNPGGFFKTLVHPTLFQIDTATNRGAPERTVVLTQTLEPLYQADAAPNERMPLIPNDVDVAAAPGDEHARRACLTAMGSDAVFCLSIDDEGALQAIGAPGSRFVELQDSPSGQVSHRPIGLALSRKNPSPFGLVVNDGTQDLSVIDPGSNVVTELAALTEGVPRANDVRESPANSGRTLFSTGLTLWSFQGQAWSSCESCHPDGLSDGLTWFFTRGPRRTISTAGTYSGDQRRVMLWTGNIDEVHDVEAIARGVAGGMGAMIWTYPGVFPAPRSLRILYASEPPPLPQGAKRSSLRRDGLNGSIAALIDRSAGRVCSGDDDECDVATGHEWDDIDAFIRSVRAPRMPASELDADLVVAGQAVFEEARCGGCHAGPAWTLSRVFYTPGEKNNGTVPFTKPAGADPAMRGALRTTSYDVTSEELRLLNPPAKSGSAPFRRVPPDVGDDILAAAYSSTLADQINCVLRDVGTFPTQPVSGDPNTTGIVPKGAPPVSEVRPNTAAGAPPNAQTLALGATGFNIPSLFGLSLGAPYFHGGNARTLEEVFDVTFAAHYKALNPDFEPSAADIRALVAYLLSIDDQTPTVRPSSRTYDLCAQATFE